MGEGMAESPLERAGSGGHAGEWRSARWIREQLEQAEDYGYFGPGSAMWLIHREFVVSLGLGRALLLQLAHPWVAQAVADHSTFRETGFARLYGTLAAAELLIFGSRRQSDLVAGHIRWVHTRIHGRLEENVGRWRAGDCYSAEDPDALRWVLATLVDTAIVLYESCFDGLEEATVERYLVEAEALGSMIGVIPGSFPRTRVDLQAYMEQCLIDGTIAVGGIAQQLVLALVSPAWCRRDLVLTWPYRAACRAFAASTIPEPLRHQYGGVLMYGYPWLHRALGQAGRRLLNGLPPHWRYDPFGGPVVLRAEGERMGGIAA
jgi:uncharacterized protein (DUF2236 family)